MEFLPRETVKEITSHLSKVSYLNSLKKTCKRFHFLIELVHCRDDNSMEILLRLYPNNNWDWNALSRNPIMKWELITKYPKGKWNWRELSKRMSLDVIANNMDYPWDLDIVCQFHNVPWELVAKHPDKEWNYEYLSATMNVTCTNDEDKCQVFWQIIEENFSLGWSFPYLSRNKNISWKAVQSYSKFPWSWYDLNQNEGFIRSMTDEEILSCPHINFKHLSKNRAVTIRFIRATLEKDWDWWRLSSNITFTLDDILGNLDLPWVWLGVFLNNFKIKPEDIIKCGVAPICDQVWDFISTRGSLSTSFVLEHIDKPWDMDMLSSSNAITIDVIKKHPKRGWNWEGVSCGNNIMWQDIMNNPQYPWDISSVCTNANINWYIVKSNPQYAWEWNSMSSNRFEMQFRG